MTHLAPAPDALIGKRFDVAVAKMLGISRAKASDLVASGQARARRAYMRVKARELQLRMVYFEDASEELQAEWADFQRWRRTERKRRAYHEKKRAGR